MKMARLNEKRAAMEMSVGTIVTIVLLMTVLILGLVMIRTIFKGATGAIEETNSAIEAEIATLFTKEGSKIVVFPREREIRMNQGDQGGFAFSIENKDPDGGEFTYEVSVEEIAANCQMTDSQAESLIVLGRSGSENLRSGARLDESIFVKFSIPETAPLCLIRYSIEVEKDGEPYTSSTMDLEIE